MGRWRAVRVWSHVLTKEDIQGRMFSHDIHGLEGIVAAYSFAASDMEQRSGRDSVRDLTGAGGHSLLLWADGPRWQFSTAPLSDPSGKPLEAPKPGAGGGQALSLTDQQVLMVPKFKNWPASAITVEFWMWSVDRCRQGVPFSYATGAYEAGDNTFLLFNYNDWGVSVMEDEGHLDDHTSGISATDGAWHHIALTWQSSDGRATLYDNARKVWSVQRAQGKTMPDHGTLVIGREQDCVGGCFDSLSGGTGQVEGRRDQEYGPQDFYGVIDELRVWRTVRSPEQIAASMRAGLQWEGGAAGEGGQAREDPPSEDDPDLVAFWNFDQASGFVVKDVTGHGNDLLMSAPPTFEVIRWVAACGNGIVEGQEECDTGDTQGGNGCSPYCRVEEGWACTGLKPSTCHPLVPGEKPSYPSRADGKSGGSTGGSSPSGGGGHHALAITLGVLAALVLFVGLGEIQLLLSLCYVIIKLAGKRDEPFHCTRVISNVVVYMSLFREQGNACTILVLHYI
eukprot:jgi/Botrbrau1/10660/Bobra.53_2s0017.2